jgi:hypothetical protein
LSFVQRERLARKSKRSRNRAASESARIVEERHDCRGRVLKSVVDRRLVVMVVRTDGGTGSLSPRRPHFRGQAAASGTVGWVLAGFVGGRA